MLKKQLLYLLCLIACFAYAQEVKDGAYYVNLQPSRGLTLFHRLWNISTTSRVLAVDKNWNNYLYDRNMAAEAIESKNGTSGFYEYKPTENYQFKLEKYRVSVEGDIATIELEGTLDANCEPGALEYTALVMPDNYVQGSTYIATMADGSVKRGDFDKINANGTMLLDEFQKIEMTAPDGNSLLTIESAEGNLLTITEFRTNPWFERSYGIRFATNIELEPGRKISHKTVVSCRQIQNKPTEEHESSFAANQGKIVEIENIYKPQLLEDNKIPKLFEPRENYPGNGLLTVGNLKLEGDVSGKFLRAANRVWDDEFKQIEALGRDTTVAVFVDEKYRRQATDGFEIEITTGRINIFSDTERGAFHALQTLRWLHDGNGVIPCQTIIDYPDMDYRGVMFYAAAGTVEFHKTLIDRVYSPLRLNKLLIECSTAWWDTFPNLRNPRGMRKEELKELINYANENYIDVAPHISTLGHMRWFFDNNQNLEFAEDPETPYSYYTSHPALYPLMTTFLDEVRETFNAPEYIHIGHDEWTLDGRYPHREKTRKKTLAQIFFDDVMFYHSYAARNNMRVMMWQDMLTTIDESPGIGAGGPPHNLKDLREKLPKDIMFAVWRYDENITEYNDVAALAKEGFPVIGAGWNAPGNVETLTRFTHAQNGEGYLQTTWAGFFPDKTSIKSNFDQLASYVRAGVFSWNSESASVDYHQAMRKLWLRNTFTPSASGMVVEVPVTATGKESVLPEETIFSEGFVDGVYFKRFNSGSCAVRSRLQPLLPDSVNIPLGIKAKKIHFLNTSKLIETEPIHKVGAYTLNYADGTKETFTLRTPDDVQQLVSVPTLMSGTEVYSGAEARLRSTSVENPHPEKMIESVTMSNEWRLLPFELVAITVEK